MTLLRCSACSGLGYTANVGYFDPCLACNGRGKLILETHIIEKNGKVTIHDLGCKACKGTGNISKATCTKCKGTGIRARARAIDSEIIRIPVEELQAALTEQGENEYVRGVLGGLWIQFADEGTLLRILSDEGAYIELDGTGIWVCAEDGLAAKVLDFDEEVV